MGKFSLGGKLSTMDVIGYTKTAHGGETAVTGNVATTCLSYKGDASGSGDIDGNIASVADITNPSSWTNVVNLTGGPFAVQFFDDYNSEAGFLLGVIQVSSAEDSGDSLRMQVQIDGTTAFDAYIIGDNANTQNFFFYVPVAGSLGNAANKRWSQPIVCNDTFVIRAASKGTFTNASSTIQISNGTTCYYTRYDFVTVVPNE